MIFLPFLRSSLRQPAFLPLAGLLFSASTLLHGQSVTYTGTSPALNFGTVNVCPSGATTPAPCSNTLALTYNVTGSGTLGIPKVVTEGAPNLDYTLASGSTCTGLVTQGTTCAVKVTLAPRYAGERKGAVEIVDASGNVLATTLVYGIGVAPQIAFDPAAQTTIGVAPSFPCFVAVDELGNVYLENYFYGSITKVLPDGGTPTSLGSGLNGPLAVALDGAGDVLIADNLKVWEVPADGGAQVVLPFTGVESPQDVAVDGSGNVFVSYYNFVGDDSVGAVAELPAGGDQITLPFTGLDIPYSLAVNNVGDVFVSDYDVTGPVRAAYIFELPASGGGQTMLPFPYAVQGQLAADSAGDLFVGDSPQIMQLPAGASVPIAISDFPSTAAADQNVAVSSAGDVYATLTNLNLVELHRSQPPSLSFPETALGTTSIPLSVQIQNIGNAALSLSGMNASGPFAVVPGSGTPADCTTSSSLAPGAQCNLSITFKPESEGLVTGALTLSDNSLNNNPANQVIQLSGVIGDPPQAQLSATKLSFGHVPYPAGSTLPLTITNVGGGTLTIAPSINGPSYTIAGSTCGAGLYRCNTFRSRSATTMTS